MHEILTLQLGPVANHVGTHFWNTQEAYLNETDIYTEFDHDVLFRAGLTGSGEETYTPRTLIYDLKGAFGSIQKYNKLYSGMEAGVEWEQDVNTIKSERYQHPYQQQLELLEEGQLDTSNAALDLDQTVTTWSDYNRFYYHPLTMNTITTHQVDDPLSPFDTYSTGRQAYHDNEKENDIFDNAFRQMVEECDQLQGFQVLASADDGFGGFTEELLNNVRDEFSKSVILTFGLMSNSPLGNERWLQKRSINQVYSTTRLSSVSSIYAPLYCPSKDNIRKSGLSNYLHPDCQSLYHTSAILSAAIETVTLPSRLKKNKMTLGDLDGLLNWRRDTKLAGMSTSVPLPISVDTSQFGWSSLPSLDLSSLRQQATPKEVYGESSVIRGCPLTELSSSAPLKAFMKEDDCHNPLRKVTVLDGAYPLPDSYPRFFANTVTAGGLISNNTNCGKPFSIPVMAQLSTNSNIGHLLHEQLNETKSVSMKDYFEYTEGVYGLSVEEYKEMQEEVMNTIDIYSPQDSLQ